MTVLTEEEVRAAAARRCARRTDDGRMEIYEYAVIAGMDQKSA